MSTKWSDDAHGLHESDEAATVLLNLQEWTLTLLK
jgi:hypothetical protein